MIPDHSPSSSSYSWLSVHIYYNEPWERLLSEVLLPYVEILERMGILESYFFVRYWVRGPHIRLRLLASTELIEKMLRQNLEEHFQNYFESVPSMRQEPHYPAGVEAAQKWLPNNTLQYVTYEQEYARYGGERGMAIAEQQFALSSRVVLKMISPQWHEWSYDDAMGGAIRLHLCFLAAAGMQCEEMISFLSFYYENWLGHSFGESLALNSGVRLRSVRDSDWVKNAAQKTRQRFEDAYQVQKENLLSFHRVLYRALDSGGDDFAEKYMREWIQGSRELLGALSQAKRNKHLDERSTDFAYQSQGYKYYDSLWEHYADYIHMTNNRLGIHNRDESYLSFLMMRALQDMGELSEGEEGISGEWDKPEKNFFITLD